MIVVVAGRETFFRQGVMAILAARTRHKCVEAHLASNVMGIALACRARVVIIGPLGDSFGSYSQVGLIAKLAMDIPVACIVTIGFESNNRDEDLYLAGVDVALDSDVSVDVLVEVVRYLRKSVKSTQSMTKTDFDRRRWVGQALCAYMSLDEIKTLAFEFDVDFDDLPHDTRPIFALELTRLLAAKGRLDEAIEAILKRRPNIPLLKGD